VRLLVSLNQGKENHHFDPDGGQYGQGRQLMSVLVSNEKFSGGGLPVCAQGPVEAPRAGTSMRRVALIYNPHSGQHSRLRSAVIDDALAVLRRAGIEAETLETYAAGSAGTQALEAVRRGCDTILACGGDGTVHEILQCLVGTPVALGVVPLGTANALAANLGLGSSPAKAIRRLLDATPVRIPVGLIHYRDADGERRSRYFTVAAGVGADALFMSLLDTRLKRRFGYALYLVQGLRVWATHSFPLFKAGFQVHGSRNVRVEEVSQLLAVRIRDFGGLLHNLAPGATLHKDTLRVVAFKTRNRMHFLRFMLAVMCGRQTFSHEVELLNAATVECHVRPGSTARVFVEADGELLGALPVRIEMVPDALTVLVPSGVQP
jgi:YegS/Rv2252/BmrU family lipid kinase